MNEIVFFDKDCIQNFYPLCLTKPFSELRMGILSFADRWRKLLDSYVVGYITAPHLSSVYHLSDISKTYLFVNPMVLPNQFVVDKILNLKEGQALFFDHKLVAANTNFESFSENNFNSIQFENKLEFINNLWDLFQKNHTMLRYDFDLMTKNRSSAAISSTNGVMNEKDIFLEKSATVDFSVLNAKEGPIYIGENAEIMEGCMIRGGFSLGENSKLNMGTKIYGATTIGHHCKVGGEINNSIFSAFSNKAHDGFLGNSVIGEWCNLGAGTNNSNLKNNYTNVKLYNYKSKKFVDTVQQFCGLMMGDHSKSAIGTRFNTGTVVGVSSNIFQNGFPRNFIPSFCWGDGGKGSYEFGKAIETAAIVMKRRGLELSESDNKVLFSIFDNDI